MHELSIAANIVEIAGQHARDHGARVAGVTLRIGRLACVHEESLRYSFALMAEGTAVSGAILSIVAEPVRIWCPACAAERELPGIQKFACPACGHSSGDVRGGRELEIDSIRIEPLTTEAAEPS